MKTVKTTLLAAMVCVSSIATAQVSHVISAFNLSHIRTASIGTVVSQPGESLDDFLMDSVRPELRTFADRTNFKGCGEIAYNEGTKVYSVILSEIREAAELRRYIR